MTKQETLLEIQKKLTDIAFYMQTTLAFPLEQFELKISDMTALEQLAFINEFSKRHPKVVSPIVYKP